MLTYRLDLIPFSLAGSYLTISARNRSGTHRLIYQTCSRRAITDHTMPFFARDFFEIALTKDGAEIPYTWIAQPHRLDLTATSGGTATFVFADSATICFSLNGVGLRLLPCKPFSSVVSPAPGTFCLIDWAGRGHHQVRAEQGTHIQVTASPTIGGLETHLMGQGFTIDIVGNSGALRFTRPASLFEESLPPFSTIVQQREQEFVGWLAHMPQVPDRYRETAEQAWYLLWSCQVEPAGLLTRPILLMSKFTMNSIWSWDNCFSALAIARADIKAAWDQLLIFLEHAEPGGMVPDHINDLDEHYCFTKPPIHGWTIMKLVNMVGIEPSLPFLQKTYAPLCRLTEWWYTMRDFDHDGICQYHHGNDSGWDNATVFDYGYPCEASDLSAHLVLQCEGLAFMAKLLGKNSEAERWQVQARQQLAALLQHSVHDRHFVSPLSGSHTVGPSQSLLNYVPLVLGRRLPADITAALFADLKPGGPFLTAYGLATESPLSKKYEPDGYWRGPIWAPSTYLIFDGLLDRGETELASMIAERFCTMCAADPGFWENFDALTGKGQRCPAYSWTAAVFLLLAEWLADQERLLSALHSA